MKPRCGWAPPLLLCLLMGCSRTPVSTAVPDAVEQSPASSSTVVQPSPAAQDRKPTPPKEIAVPRENPEILKNREAGLIRGVVRWEGPEPAQSSPRLRIDPKTHGIAGTAVWLVLVSKMASSPPLEPVRLSAEQGEYRPHLVLARKGSKIELRTAEDRADFQASGAATFSETLRRGDSRVFPLSSVGLIEVRSQLQPQRTPAYVWVLDNGPGTITATDGIFQMPRVPAGNYELVLWHEDWHGSDAAAARTARVRIALGAEEGAEVRWTLAENK